MNDQELEKLEKKIAKTLEQLKNQKIILALSGGPDSVFLLNIAKNFTDQIFTAHLNHKIRGVESDKDAEFCKKIGINHQEKILDIPALAKKNKKSLEEQGRISRYKFLGSIAKKYQIDYVVTGHHANDNAETIILNLARGASLQGLTGMETIIKVKDYKIFRPLLEYTKVEILDYLKAKKIPYKKDKTNSNTKYSRNHIRHKIIPELEKINPNFLKTLSNNLTHLKETKKFLQQEAEKWLKENKKRMSTKNFTTLPKILQKEILFTLHEKIIGNCQNISSKQIDEVLLVIGKNTGKKEKKFGKLILQIDKGKIKLSNL